jgi:hypothetical protein
MAWLGAGDVGPLPNLGPGDSAPDYRLMWELAFAGWWTDIPSAARMPRRVSTVRAFPRSLRAAALRRAARQTIDRPPSREHVIVKSVAARLSLSWLASEFDPTMVVVWRHPLNLVSAWLQRGWQTANIGVSSPAIRARFEGTAAWPPPDSGLPAMAWALCAESAAMLEDATKDPAWIVVSHEEQSLSPPTAFRVLFDRLGLTWTDAVEQELRGADADGSGYETKRRAAEEPQRWRARLSKHEQLEVLDTISRFEDVSPAVRALWSASAAVV